ncbi:MAG: RodZ domain-containing protein [Brevinematia bacterium]
METVGNYLRNLRLSKSISIEEVVRNTNISRKYIEGIEREDFSEFPGEVYIKGYIRSYASFLGGDPEYAVKLYEKKQIEEREVPLEMLIGKRRSILDRVNVRKVLMVLSIVGIVVLLVWVVFSALFSRGYEVLVDTANVRTILKSFSVGEEFSHKLGDREINIKLIEVRNNGNDIVLSINNTISSFVLKNKSMMDFNLDGIVDLEIKYESFIEGKPKIRMSFYKSQEKKSKEEVVFLGETSLPLEFEIVSRSLVWVSVSADNMDEEQVYLKNGEEKKFVVRSKLILKTSNIESISIKVNGKQIQVEGKGPSYVVFDLIEGVKGVTIKIGYLE